jgi:CRP-like cAMP-binding protein
VIIDSDSVPDGLYIVLRGRINLVRQADGREVILAALGPGDVFGENCAFDRQPMQTSAIAATPAELLKIPAGILESHFQRSPETMVRMMRLLQTKLRDAELMASSLALHGVEERLRRTLVRLVRRQGRRAPASPNWILAPVPTQTELARMVGSCRETVSRTLSAMARDGLVSAHGRRMIVDERLLAGAA